MSEIERYNGLTTADKGALEYAKTECGYEWFARDDNEHLFGFTREPNRVGSAWDHEENIHDLLATNMKYFKYIPAGTKLNIDRALAQIAEMESKPLTWNERINQMTVEEKATWLYDMDVCRISSISVEECNSYRHCTECMKNMLNSAAEAGK